MQRVEATLGSISGASVAETHADVQSASCWLPLAQEGVDAASKIDVTQAGDGDCVEKAIAAVRAAVDTHISPWIFDALAAALTEDELVHAGRLVARVNALLERQQQQEDKEEQNGA
eukprot:COSAG05_NODE_13048_length_443_cov_1.345930_1_plen_115_part_01